PKTFESNNNYQKAVKFGNAAMRNNLDRCNSQIRDKIELDRVSNVYQNAVDNMNRAHTETEFQSAAKLFLSVNTYKNAEELANKCSERAKQIHAEEEERIRVAKEREIEDTYKSAVSDMLHDTLSSLKNAVTGFKSIGDYKDSVRNIEKCETRIEQLTQLEIRKLRKKKRKRKIITITSISSGAMLAAVAALVMFWFVPLSKYNKAEEYLNVDEQAQAYTIFKELGHFKDAPDKALEILKDMRGNCDKTISAKQSNTAALKTDGTVYAVGNDSYSQCNVAGWSDITKIAVGCNIIVGLKSDGTVIAAGNDVEGIAEWQDIVNIEASDCIYGIKSDGTVVCNRANEYNNSVAEWHDIVDISASQDHVVGLRVDGTVVAAGTNSYGQCNVSDWKDIIAVSAGSFHTVGLKVDGTVVAIGKNGDGQCYVFNWKDIISISAGGFHTIGLKSSGTVVAVGYNVDGQGDISEWNNIVAVAIGKFHTIGFKVDGTAVSVGINASKQCNVSNWNDIATPSRLEFHVEKMIEEQRRQEEEQRIQEELLHQKALPILKMLEENRGIGNEQSYISAGSHCAIALKDDGSVLAIGDYKTAQGGEPDWSEIIKVAAGKGIFAGLKDDGTVVTTDAYCRFDTDKWQDIVAIDASSFICGLKSNGTVLCSHEIIDDNNVVNWQDSINDEEWQEIVAISISDTHIVGLKADGTVVSGGIDRHGKCDVSNWSDIVAVSAGDNHTVGLKSDGTVVAVGNNYYGQCEVSDWKEIVAISAGEYHTVGLKSDGTVIAVGNNEGGQCEVANWKDIIAISAGDNFIIGEKADGTVIACGGAYIQRDVYKFQDIAVPQSSND
ncbi:MAG: hypothetical protein NC548_60280, partial [Lachnospiraceae bacterium]|nr:hypothetical protein [Lachnospiraceae bacterium]